MMLITVDGNDRDNKMLSSGSGGSARACVLQLLNEVGGPEFGLGMMVFARGSRTKLDHFRVFHIYVL